MAAVLRRYPPQVRFEAEPLPGRLLQRAAGLEKALQLLEGWVSGAIGKSPVAGGDGVDGDDFGDAVGISDRLKSLNEFRCPRFFSNGVAAFFEPTDELRSRQSRQNSSIQGRRKPLPVPPAPEIAGAGFQPAIGSID